MFFNLFNLAAISFNPSNFVKNLSYMGFGMLTIFVIIAIIIIVTAILSKCSSKDGKK